MRSDKVVTTIVTKAMLSTTGFEEVWDMNVQKTEDRIRWERKNSYSRIAKAKRNAKKGK